MNGEASLIKFKFYAYPPNTRYCLQEVKIIIVELRKNNNTELTFPTTKSVTDAKNESVNLFLVCGKAMITETL